MAAPDDFQSLSDEQLATLLRLTERYCVVCQTLVRPPTMTVTRQAIEV